MAVTLEFCDADLQEPLPLPGELAAVLLLLPPEQAATTSPNAAAAAADMVTLPIVLTRVTPFWSEAR